MKLCFFSANFVGQLSVGASANLAKYGGGASWIDSISLGRVFVHESNIVVDPPPQLLISEEDNTHNDAENAKRIYTWLSKLTPALAMEERLWAYLTHVVFIDYMKARWPVENVNTIQRRYLFEGKSFASLSRNGISRLWWAGFLTHDGLRKNPFELTETLFLRQDIHVSLLERSISKCKSARFAVLDFLRENNEWFSTKSFGKRIQLLLKEMNLLGGVVILDAVPPEDLRLFLKKAGESLAKQEDLPDTAGS